MAKRMIAYFEGDNTDTVAKLRQMSPAKRKENLKRAAKKFSFISTCSSDDESLPSDGNTFGFRNKGKNRVKVIKTVCTVSH